MKYLMIFSVLLLAVVLAPSSLFAQTASCQPDDCAKVCCTAGASATSTAAVKVAQAETSKGCNSAFSVVSLLPPAPSSNKTAAKAVAQGAATGNCLPSPSCCKAGKTTTTAAQSVEKAEVKKGKL